MEAKTQIDLPLVLPDIPDERDACVQRLEMFLAHRSGIVKAHVISREGAAAALCLHYDADMLPLSQVRSMAQIAGAEVTAKYGHAVFPIRAIDGEDAARRIESALADRPGVLHASVNLAAQRARVEFDRSMTSVEQIRKELLSLGYPSGEPADAHSGSCCRPREPVPEGAGWLARNKELAWSLSAAVLLLIAWAGERWLRLPHAAAIALYIGAYAFGAWDLVRHWAASLLKGKVSFDIDLLMLIAAVGAAVLGEWAEGAFLLVLFSFAHALEHYAMGRARNAIRALSDLSPPVARVKRDGGEAEVPVEQVQTGEVVIVRPGERVPVDGKVRSGRSAVNQAPITGESVPVDKGPDDEVFAGTVNGDGALEVTTTKAAGDRTLDRVIKLVEEAQTQKAPTQQFTERFERVFVPAVLIGDVLLIVLPPLFGWWTWGQSFYRGMALLVAASPCALALGTPSAVLAAIAQAARNGVLIKGGAHLEELGQLKAIAFDKTGTLTVGKPEVTDIVPTNGIAHTELLAVAGAVERQSQHPLAQAVVRRVESDRVAMPEATELQSVTGKGVRSTIDGQTVEIGNLRMWADGVEAQRVPADLKNAVAGLQAGGRSVMVVRRGDSWLGVLGLADRPRDDVKAILDRLRRLGLGPLVMLTGDNQGVGKAIGREVGVDEVRADLMPEDKVTAIRRLLAEHGRVAMVGDGVNDAPALANATVGIAMGGAGTAVALETADVALMSDDLGKLPFAVGLSRRARSTIRQNLFLSLAVVAGLVVATTTGWFGIGLAVAFHEGSTLAVIANSLRLLTYSSASSKAV